MSKRTSTPRTARGAAPNTRTKPEVVPPPEPPRAELPPSPDGYKRVPLYPAIWTGEGELRGVLVDVGTVQGFTGRREDALVVIASGPTKGRNVFGDETIVDEKGAIRLVDPEAISLAPFAQMEEHVLPIVARYVVDRGMRRLVIDLGTTPLPRAGFTPSLAPQTAGASG